MTAEWIASPTSAAYGASGTASTSSSSIDLPSTPLPVYVKEPKTYDETLFTSGAPRLQLPPPAYRNNQANEREAEGGSSSQ